MRASEQSQLAAAAAGHVGARREGARAGEIVVLPLEPAAALAGVVVDAAGRPVAGAALRAGPSDGGAFHSFRDHSQRAASGADGSFRFPRLLPRQLYEITARHDEHAPARLLARTPPAGASAPQLRLVLGAGQSATGRVVDADGKPLAGVEVSLQRVQRPHGRHGAMAFSVRGHGPLATSDAAGRFRFRHLEPGEYDLRAARQGFAPAGRQGVEVPPQSAEVDLGELLLEPGIVLEGRVTGPKGVPVAGAHVVVFPPDFRFERWNGWREPVTTGADGVFRLADLRRGERLRLQVGHPEYAELEPLEVQVPTAEPLAIELRPRGALAVRVVGPDGEPVAGANVSALLETHVTTAGVQSGSNTTSYGLGATDGEGSLVAQPPPGHYDLEVRAAGYETRRVGGAEVPAGGEARRIEVALRRGAPLATLVGRVVDHLGQPLPGFTVRAETVQQPGDLDPFEQPFRDGTPTDAEGAYRIADLRPAKYVVRARAGTRTARGAITLDAGTARLDLVVPAGVEVSGRVIDAAGQPFAGAAVRLRSLAGGEQQRTSSAADGSFLFDWVPDGLYGLSGEARGYADAAAPGEVRVAGAAVGGLELVLGERSGAISGRILGVEPEDLARVWVNAHARGAGMIHGRAGADGSYRLADLSPGTWQVRAGLDGTHASGTVRLEPGQPEATLDLELTLRPVVSGRATLDGQPLAGAQLRFQAEQPGGTETAHDGSFRLRLAPGRYTLVLLAPRQGIGYSRAVEVGPDGAEVVIDLVGASLSGRVVTRGGIPIEAAVIAAEGFDPHADISYSGPGTRTDAAGLFELPRLAPGHYRLTVSADGFAETRAEVELPEGRTVELEIPLVPAAEEAPGGKAEEHR